MLSAVRQDEALCAWLQILHTISNEQLELVNSMAPYMETQVLPILKETTTMWQPADFLPESSSDTFIDEVGRLSVSCRNSAAPAVLHCCPG